MTLEELDRGTVEILWPGPSPEIRLTGGKLSGDYEIVDQGGGAWSFERVRVRIEDGIVPAGDGAARLKIFAPFVHTEAAVVKGVERRLVYGVVYEPYGDRDGRPDAQDDFMLPEDVEHLAHSWLPAYRYKTMHRVGTDKVVPVESYIAPTDFRLGEQIVKRGSWVLVSRVIDDLLWKDVKEGRLRGYSFGGRAKVVEGAEAELRKPW